MVLGSLTVTFMSQYLYLLVKVRTFTTNLWHELFAAAAQSESQYLYLLVKVRTNFLAIHDQLLVRKSQYLYLLVKVRTCCDKQCSRDKIRVAIPIPSGEGQNVYRSQGDRVSIYVAIPIPSGEGQNIALNNGMLVLSSPVVSQYLYLLVKVRTHH